MNSDDSKTYFDLGKSLVTDNTHIQFDKVKEALAQDENLKKVLFFFLSRNANIEEKSNFCSAFHIEEGYTVSADEVKTIEKTDPGIVMRMMSLLPYIRHV